MPSVVVVEDDDEICDALQMLLVDEGYTVAHAHSGVRGLELLRRSPGEGVVLFDYKMPHGDGLYFLTAVAAEAPLRRRYAYICLAAADLLRLPAEFTALRDRLDVPFVSKPFDIDTVVTAVEDAQRRLLARSAAQRPTGADAEASEAAARGRERAGIFAPLTGMHRRQHP